MSVQSILLPLFVEVGLTFVLLLLLFVRRAGAYRRGEVAGKPLALREPNWGEGATKAGYAFSNQFELPVLFYVLTILALVTNKADMMFVFLAWLFVFARIAQAIVHVTTNDIRLRGAFYAAGAAILALMWGAFIIAILFARVLG